MLFGKLIKPCKICIYEQQEDGGEIESFSLLKLSLSEVYRLLVIIADKKDIETTLDGSIAIKYSGNDVIHHEWKKLASEHLKKNPNNFIDVSKKYKSDILGTSCLIRNPKTHIIRIALRRGDDNCTINRLCIDNSIRERFFQDAKASIYFKETKKYAIDSRDLKIYTYWSTYMNNEYIIKTRN